jgi:hypothetical protein
VRWYQLSIPHCNRRHPPQGLILVAGNAPMILDRTSSTKSVEGERGDSLLPLNLLRLYVFSRFFSVMHSYALCSLPHLPLHLDVPLRQVLSSRVRGINPLRPYVILVICWASG